jgi:hypothetical protein
LVYLQTLLRWTTLDSHRQKGRPEVSTRIVRFGQEVSSGGQDLKSTNIKISGNLLSHGIAKSGQVMRGAIAGANMAYFSVEDSHTRRYGARLPALAQLVLTVLTIDAVGDCGTISCFGTTDPRDVLSGMGIYCWNAHGSFL